MRKGEFPLAQYVENVHKDFFFRHCCFSYISFLKCKQKYFLRAIELQNVSNDNINTSMYVIVSLKLIFFCTRMHIQSYFCCLCHTQPNFRVFSKRMRIVLKYTRRAFGYDRRPLKYKRVAPPIFCNVFDITEWHACHIEMLNWVYKPLRIIFSCVT